MTIDGLASRDSNPSKALAAAHFEAARCQAGGEWIADRVKSVGFRDLQQTVLDLVGPLNEVLTELGSTYSDGGNDSGGDQRTDKVVALAMPNSVDQIITYLACLQTGRIPILVDPLIGDHELLNLKNATGSRYIIRDFAAIPSALTESQAELPTTRLRVERHAKSSERSPMPEPSTAVCRLTSGSSGEMKCLEFSPQTVTLAASTWVAATDLSSADRILCFAGMQNGLAFNTSLLASLRAGAELRLPAGPTTPRTYIRAQQSKPASVLVAFPAFYDLLATTSLSTEDVPRPRILLSAAARLKGETRAKLHKRHGLIVNDYYGLAETGPLTFDPTPPPDSSTLGFPLPGCRITTADERAQSEVLAFSPYMATTALNDKTYLGSRSENGLFRTGDLGTIRPDGRLVLNGRTGDRLNVAGRKFGAAEVEDGIRTIGARDVFVFVNDDEILCAIVDIDSDWTKLALRKACAQILAPYKVPAQISIHQVPRSSTGKPVRGAALRIIAEESRFKTTAVDGAHDMHPAERRTNK